jgi:regulator of protease activity HflC (stomatin/prohibitin superfamily)
MFCVAVGFAISANNKKFNLPKFETTYDEAVAKFGKENARIIVGTVKMATNVMGVKFTAADEAAAAITKNTAEIAEQKQTATEVAKTAEAQAKELEKQAAEVRENGKEAAEGLIAAAAETQERTNKIEDMLDLM